ncbi:MAG: ATP-binding protein [Alphaproteobacteria bacterium]|nr:ATP-binding protein [Alphaproteobacteria bacterium]
MAGFNLSRRAINFLIALGAMVVVVVCLMPGLADAAVDSSGIANTLFPSAPRSQSINDRFSSLIFGIFIGTMMTAALYLFFIWIVIRDRGQVFLMMLLVCLGTNMASTNDMLMDQIGPQSIAMRNLLQNYSMILSYILSIFFTYYFLSIYANAPKLRNFLFSFALLLVLLLAYSAFDQKLVHFALPTIGIIAITIVLIAGIISLRIGVTGSLTHIVAFLFFLLGCISEPMYNVGFIIDQDNASRLAYMSYSLAAMMFAIVIAGQFAARQEEKERALAISNERFALAAKGSNEGLFDWNLKTGEVFFSDQFKRILGVNLESTSSALKIWLKMIVPADRKTIRESLRRFRQNAQVGAINLEYRVMRLDDRKRWLHTRAVATRDSRTGKMMRLVGSTGDITDRKQGEVALRASEARFRSITEAHPVPVLIVALNKGQVLYASPGAEVLLGLPNGTLTSHFLDRFLTKADERRELLAAMNAGQEVNLKEFTVTRGDGNALTAALSARRINYQNEVAMVMGLYDLTERKEAESQIAKQQEALQQSEKMAALGGLLAGVAHELNNPLSVVVGQSTLLIEGSTEPKVIGRAEKIFKAADRCTRIVKSFLALARRKPPERKPVDINQIINSSLELLGYQFRNENVELKLELEPTLPEVNGDGDQLTQVFTNLELNAAQAMIGWQGKRQVTIRTESHGMGEVLITVMDTGPGIPADIKSRVFEPFFTTKSSKGGTGVGLSLCLNIIESHSGQVVLEDTQDGGATFFITLPTITNAQKNQEEQEKSEDHKLPRLRILLVDDEIELAQTLADLLEPEGHEIDLASDGSIALEKLRRKPFDVIISDLRMPVMDGPGLYAEISRTMPEFTKRIIYITGDTLSSHIQSFLSQNTVPVIEKPYRLVDVKRTIAKLLKEIPENSSITSVDSTNATQ